KSRASARLRHGLDHSLHEPSPKPFILGGTSRLHRQGSQRQPRACHDQRPGHFGRPASASSYRHISAYNRLVRRKPGVMLPIELAICEAALSLRRGRREFHGYDIAKAIAEREDARLLTAYGTLYRALGRLEAMGLLKSRWEDPAKAARERRPG